ncbi:3-isopropylmalate dehydratase small subunit [Pseudaestuariivita sp.]|uniref:3-isopropylmalate dehydratase small subunit n=1 Tax=Pseudaestuariivita sp. TaxID=2211669 RepID=UPI004059CDD2
MSAGLSTHTGICAILPEDNVNTDAIIPSREMRRVSKVGLADGLFAGLRYLEGRTPDPDFVLNQPRFAGASVLLSGRNFGCGSSREHAVWALRDYGFRALIAESFGGIFFDNCVANGVVPVALEAGELETLASWVEADPQARPVSIDLEQMVVTGAGREVPFALPGAQRDMLIKGHSPIDVTLEEAPLLDAFEAADRAARPWVYAVPDVG